MSQACLVQLGLRGQLSLEQLTDLGVVCLFLGQRNTFHMYATRSLLDRSRSRASRLLSPETAGPAPRAPLDPSGTIACTPGVIQPQRHRPTDSRPILVVQASC